MELSIMRGMLTSIKNYIHKHGKGGDK
jgi:hypothetical protein